MYNQQRNPFRVIFRLIILGVLIGIAYFVLDNANKETPLEQVEVIAESATLAPTLQQQPTVAPTLQSVQNTTNLPMIYVPAAAVSAPIIQVYIEGDTWNIDNLGGNVGHLQGTPWLNESGNVVLAGHVEMSDGGRGVFASLFDLEAGDTIIVEVDGLTRRYAVREIIRTEPTDLTPLYPTDTNQLTLITCDKYDFFSDEYLERVIVIADLLS